MMRDVKSYKVTILDNSYTVRSDEPENRVVEAAQYVDYLMKTIMSQGVQDHQKIGVLTSLKIVHMLRELEDKVTQSVDRLKALETILDKQIEWLLSSSQLFK